MKATYDKQIDAAYLPLADSTEIAHTHSCELDDGVMVNVDYGYGLENVIVGIEILGVKKIIK